MNEATREWQQPKESQDNRNGRDDLGVDEATLVDVVLVTNLVKPVTSKTSYDSCKGELELSGQYDDRVLWIIRRGHRTHLANAKQHREHIGEKHVCR